MIDYLSIFFKVKHIPFGKTVSYSDTNESYKKHYQRKIKVRNYNTSLSVHSKQNGALIEVSGNFVKFMQGHNIFGTNDLQGLCRDVLLELTKRLGITLTQSDLNDVIQGNYKVQCVDIAGNYRLKSHDEVPKVIRGIEMHARDLGEDVSNYGRETVYFNQHNKNKALKFYDKSAELSKHPLPMDLPERERLLEYSKNLVRAELTLGAAELKRNSLNMGHRWTVKIARQLLCDAVASSAVGGKIKRILLPTEYDELPNAYRLTYRLWVHGDDIRSLFDIQKFRRHRRALQNYKIDIAKPQPKSSIDMVDIKACLSPENMAKFPSFARKSGLLHIPSK